MKWQTMVPWALAIGAGIYILVKAFAPSKTQDTFYRDKYIESLNDKLKMSEGYRKEIIEIKNAELAESRKRDSLSIIRSKINTIRYEKVPVIVNAIPHSELASAIESEFGQ